MILTYCVLLFPKIKDKEKLNIPFPVVFVANHVSFFDLFISGAVLPGYPRGLEIKEHFSKPIYGWFIARFGQIPIDVINKQGIIKSFNHAARQLRDRVRNLLVMPEGSRTRNGKLKRFKTGAFYLSRKVGVPIVPVIYKNLFDHNNRNSIIIKPGRIDVRILDPVYPADFSSDQDMMKYVEKKMQKYQESSIPK